MTLAYDPSGYDVRVVIAPSTPNGTDGGSILLATYGDFLHETGSLVNTHYQISFADGTLWSEADLVTKLGTVNGTAQNDTLTGSKYGDTITGGRGNDTLTGGSGVDTFVFHQGDGQDVITDFVATGTGHDILQLDPALVTSWTDLLSKATQSGANMVIAANANDKITLNNVALSSLTADDFRFQA